jgi:hypothetical protein
MFDAADEEPDKTQTLVLAVDAVSRPLDLAYEQALQLIETTGVKARSARLAVVFCGGDLNGARSGKVARWASRQLGLGDLVRTVRSAFTETCFFCVAALPADEAAHESVGSLLRWLLSNYGVSPSPTLIAVDPGQVRERSYRWHRRFVFVLVATMSSALLLLPLVR